MEMTVQRFAIAQFMPARIPACVPEPELDSTLPAKIRARSRDAVARRRSGRGLRAAGSADAVRAVAVQILHRLACDERLACDGAPGEVRMTEVHAGVEDSHLDSVPAAVARGYLA